jgi:hypothetical protein
MYVLSFQPRHDHGDGSTQNPRRLGSIDPLPNLDRACVIELVSESQERMYARQIEAILDPVYGLYCYLVAHLVLLPRRSPARGPRQTSVAKSARRRPWVEGENEVKDR